MMIVRQHKGATMAFGDKSRLIRQMAKDNPHMRPHEIAAIVGSSPASVRVTLYRSLGNRGDSIKTAVNTLPVAFYQHALEKAQRTRKPIAAVIGEYIRTAIEAEMAGEQSGE